MAEPVCYAWTGAWPHALADIGRDRKTSSVPTEVTCRSCLWALIQANVHPRHKSDFMLLEDPDGAPYPEPVQLLARTIEERLDDSLRDLTVEACESIVKALAETEVPLDNLEKRLVYTMVEEGVSWNEAERLAKAVVDKWRS